MYHSKLSWRKGRIRLGLALGSPDGSFLIRFSEGDCSNNLRWNWVSRLPPANHIVTLSKQLRISYCSISLYIVAFCCVLLFCFGFTNSPASELLTHPVTVMGAYKLINFLLHYVYVCLYLHWDYKKTLCYLILPWLCSTWQCYLSRRAWSTLSRSSSCLPCRRSYELTWSSVVTPHMQQIIARLLPYRRCRWDEVGPTLIARFIGQHGAHLGPTGSRWAPCWPHGLCYLGVFRLHGAWRSWRTNYKLFLFRWWKLAAGEYGQEPVEFSPFHMAGIIIHITKGIFEMSV